MEFSQSVDIAAAPARVWAIVRDVERWHEWTASITSVELLDAGKFAVGCRARVLQPKLLPAVFRITAVDEGRSFTWVTRHSGVVGTATHCVEPLANGSRVTLSVRFGGLFGRAIGRLARGLTERYLALEAAGLKARSESLIPDPHPSRRRGKPTARVNERRRRFQLHVFNPPSHVARRRSAVPVRADWNVKRCENPRSRESRDSSAGRRRRHHKGP